MKDTLANSLSNILAALVAVVMVIVLIYNNSDQAERDRLQIEELKRKAIRWEQDSDSWREAYWKCIGITDPK